MGYHTEFRGILKFTTELTAPRLVALNQLLGEDCREHPGWKADGLSFIDLKLLDDHSGLAWDGSECTYNMPELVNVVIREMQKRYPEFGLSGVLTAQGSEVGDVWELYIGEDGLAWKRELRLAPSDESSVRITALEESIKSALSYLESDYVANNTFRIGVLSSQDIQSAVKILKEVIEQSNRMNTRETND